MAVFGNDWFLRHHALRILIDATQVDQDAVRTRQGDETKWRDVHDDLASRSLFDEGGQRLTIIHGADTFVSQKNRLN